MKRHPEPKAHLEVLGRDQRRVLERLGPLAEAAGFVLAGGTGLALQLGHRRSVDFDWFTEQALGDPLGLARRLQEEGVALRVESTERGTLHGRVSGVRVSFLEYRYPLLENPVRLPGLSTPIASIPDIACMKLSAITQRGARKDFAECCGRRPGPCSCGTPGAPPGAAPGLDGWV